MTSCEPDPAGGSMAVGAKLSIMPPPRPLLRVELFDAGGAPVQCYGAVAPALI